MHSPVEAVSSILIYCLICFRSSSDLSKTLSLFLSSNLNFKGKRIHCLKTNDSISFVQVIIPDGHLQNMNVNEHLSEFSRHFTMWVAWFLSS